MLYPYYSDSIAEDEQFTIFHPRVDVLDGTEPTIEELLDFNFTYSNEVNK